MKKIGWILVCLIWLVGCNEEHYQEINPHQDFVASVNILDPSLVFYDVEGATLATWNFDLAYTGASLIQQDRVLMYGHELPEAHIYELSSGKKITTIQTGLGTTNVYYDVQSAQFFITNSQSNTVTSYDAQGKKLAQQKVYNYPMSMTAMDGKLYVVNYKDTVLSVLDSQSLAILDHWTIEHSSQGLMIVNDELWMGGHGQGSKANKMINRYHLKTGVLMEQLEAPLMPIGFSKQGNELAVVSHGDNMLYLFAADGKLVSQQKIGANPFAVAHLDDRIIVAGYDDHTIYFLEHTEVVKQVKTNAGPFQLLVRGN